MKKIIVIFILVLLIFSLGSYTFKVENFKNSNNKEVINPNLTSSTDYRSEGLSCIYSLDFNSSKVEKGSVGTGFAINISGSTVIQSAEHIFGYNNTIIMRGCNENNIINNSNVKKSKKYDVSVLKIDKDINKVYEYSEDTPKKKNKVTFIGFYEKNIIEGYGKITKIGSPVKDLEEYPSFGLFEISVENNNSIKNGISGGPVFNSKGKVIGSIIATRKNKIIALDYRILENLSKKLLNKEKPIPSLPVDVSNNIKNNKQGVIITEVSEEYKGTLEEPRLEMSNKNGTIYDLGDRILEVNNNKINNIRDLKILLISKYSKGDKVNLKIKNENNNIEIIRVQLK